MAEEIVLPIRPFFYTLDQLETLLNVSRPRLLTLLFFRGVSPGPHPPDRLLTVDISNDYVEKPDWRVEENELTRWLRYRGYQVKERRATPRPTRKLRPI